MTDALRSAVDELDRIARECGDAEGAHIWADQVLLEYLRASGSEQVADAFERCKDEIGFWYA